MACCEALVLCILAEYAQVLRMLGNGRLEAFCIDGVKRLCHIRGKMRKKVWVNTVRLRRSWPAMPSDLRPCVYIYSSRTRPATLLTHGCRVMSSSWGSGIIRTKRQM